MAETDATEEQFAGVDAVIAAAEAEAAALPPDQGQEALDLVYGADRSAARQGRAGERPDSGPKGTGTGGFEDTSALHSRSLVPPK